MIWLVGVATTALLLFSSVNPIRAYPEAWDDSVTVLLFGFGLVGLSGLFRKWRKAKQVNSHRIFPLNRSLSPRIDH